MNENNHALSHPEDFLGLTVGKISDAVLKKPMSLLISLCCLQPFWVRGAAVDTAECLHLPSYGPGCLMSRQL